MEMITHLQGFNLQQTDRHIVAAAARRAEPDSMLILCVSVCVR